MINYFGTKKNLYPLFYYFQSSNWTEDHFVDLFGGGGSVTMDLQGIFPKRTWNDLYKPAYYFFKCLQEDFSKLREIIRNTGIEKARNNLYHFPTEDPWLLAASFYLYSETCFNGNAGSNWDVGISARKSYSISKLRKIRSVIEGVDFLNLNFRDIPNIPGAIYYADPPYDWEDRASKDIRSNSKYPRRRYFHEFSRQDHYDLRDYLSDKNFIVSHYDSDFYDHLYKGCQKIKLNYKEAIWVKRN